MTPKETTDSIIALKKKVTALTSRATKQDKLIATLDARIKTLESVTVADVISAFEKLGIRFRRM